ncbi:Molybdopterin converting factor, small subunit [Thiothrix eikelboomii]|uniref:Molybdopterin converting factor, small subunit n=1 Tax=Thiothrix eikelboomii TaxID=92487 RepID=A0A1T4VXP9_9GAMM|nr:MoaD/ThiS family protein [Thiothrix eikelboomii]SKA69763.1 Molybdopterin converting factor, small subunit [Thiothrix eikelboomii]
MQITLKLYAHLGDLLPANSKQNKAEIEVPESISLNELIDRFQIPRPMAHLVLVNGLFVCDRDRDQPFALKPKDAVAIWPPVAGG